MRLHPLPSSFTLASSGAEEGLQTLRHSLEPFLLKTVLQNGSSLPSPAPSTAACVSVKGAAGPCLGLCLAEPVSHGRAATLLVMPQQP